jgi:hypothetical protein
MSKQTRRYKGETLRLVGPCIEVDNSVGVRGASLDEVEGFIDGWRADERYESECDSQASRRTED